MLAPRGGRDASHRAPAGHGSLARAPCGPYNRRETTAFPASRETPVPPAYLGPLGSPAPLPHLGGGRIPAAPVPAPRRGGGAGRTHVARRRRARRPREARPG